LERLRRWSQRQDLRERAAQAAFIEEFVRQTWGYVQAGQAGAEAAFSIHPDFPVRQAGGRKSNFADAALGRFLASGADQIPQVLCEFKDIRSGLDAPQRRKNDNRSPVQQGLGYLAAARAGMFGHEPIVPTWAIITDMNEFRLYWADRGDRQSLRFVITPRDLFQGPSLIADTEEARFDRFLFQRLFHRDTLTVQANSGRARLLGLIEQQRFRQRAPENTFYAEYRAFREHLYTTLLAHNGEGTARFPGTRGRRASGPSTTTAAACARRSGRAAISMAGSTSAPIRSSTRRSPTPRFSSSRAGRTTPFASGRHTTASSRKTLGWRTTAFCPTTASPSAIAGCWRPAQSAS
jgi:hypothetical protein